MKNLDYLVSELGTHEKCLPTRGEEYTYITDASILVKLPNHMISENIVKTEKERIKENPLHLTIKRMEELFDTDYNEAILYTNELEYVLNLVPTRVVYAECTQCKGEGSLVCYSCGGNSFVDGEPCEQCKGWGDVDCYKCDGTGENRYKVAGSDYVEFCYIDIDGVLFRPYYIKKILDLAQSAPGVNLPIFVHHLDHDYKLSVFQVGDIMIALMPCDDLNETFSPRKYKVDYDSTPETFDIRLLDAARLTNDNQELEVLMNIAKTRTGEKAIKGIKQRRQKYEEHITDTL